MTPRTVQFMVSAQSSSAPAWYNTAVTNGWPVGEWIRVGGTTVDYGLTPTNTCLSVATGAGSSAISLNADVFYGWDGATLCQAHRTHGTMLFGPGGAHNAGDDGEIFLFDLATRRWEEVAPKNLSGYDDPWSPAIPDDANPYGEYNNGAPTKNHSGSWAFYDSYRHEWAYPKGWGSPASGSDQYFRPWGHGFNLAAYDANGYSPSQWRRWPQPLTDPVLGFAAGQLSALGQISGGTWDAATNRYFISAAATVMAMWHSHTNTWTKLAPNGMSGVASAIDPIRRVLVHAGAINYGPTGVYLLQLADVTRRNTIYAQESLWRAMMTGNTPNLSDSFNMSGAAFQWSDALGGFIHYNNALNPTLVKVARYVSGGLSSFPQGVGYTPVDYTLDWSDLTLPTNTLTPFQNTGKSTMQRFRVAKWGAAEVGILADGATGPVYAFRIN